MNRPRHKQSTLQLAFTPDCALGVDLMCAQTRAQRKASRTARACQPTGAWGGWYWCGASEEEFELEAQISLGCCMRVIKTKQKQAQCDDMRSLTF
jgi:hypothetical protein